MFRNAQNFSTKILFGDDIYVGIEAGIEKLDHYYDKVSPIVGIALILDPTLKRDFLRSGLGWTKEWILSVENNFQSSYAFYKGAAATDSSEQKASDEIAEENGIVSYLKRKRNSDSGDAESEYDRYLSLPIISSTKADVLQFWKSNTFNFPTLVAMAKDYLTVQASSVPSERAFSSGTDLVTPNRCSMGGKVVEMTQFLKFVL